MNETATSQRQLLSVMVEYLVGQRSVAALSQPAAEFVARTEKPSDAAIALAAVDASATYDEIGPLVQTVAHDLGYPELTPPFCATVLALDIARDIVVGNLSAGVGANKLWLVGRDAADGADQFGLFAELADEWESGLEKRAEIEQEIRQAAEKLLAESELR